jgi:hypothetical protein
MSLGKGEERANAFAIRPIEIFVARYFYNYNEARGIAVPSHGYKERLM